MLYMLIAWRILSLIMIGRECPELPCSVLFDQEEWEAVLYRDAQETIAQRATDRQSNDRMDCRIRRLPQPKGRWLPRPANHVDQAPANEGLCSWNCFGSIS